MQNLKSIDLKFQDYSLTFLYLFLKSDNLKQTLQKILIRYLTLPLAKVSNIQDNTKLFTNIIIQDTEQDLGQVIGESIFSTIYRNKIKFAYQQNLSINSNNQQSNNQQQDVVKLQRKLKNLPEDQKLTKLVAIKIQKNQNLKIKHQKNILAQIKNLSCVNMTKFYQSNQNALKSALIMDFYMFRSLDCYINRNSKTLSLMTKIYLLCQVVQGLRFLRDNKIVHLDMKPQNILIGKGLLLRLSDFGQSYHPTVCSQDFTPGYSFPYMSPEIFSNNPNYNQKSDVYSLVFFSGLVINIANVSQDKLQEYYQEKMISSQNWQNNKIMVNGQNLSYLGPEKLMQTLAYLCLKCTKTKQIQRPFLDWILIELRESLNYLDKIC